jgi:hypothetical protein
MPKQAHEVPEQPAVTGAQSFENQGDRLRAIIDGWAQHDSWRCEYPPHYYFADGPPDDGDCACGLLSALREAGIDPEPWRPVPSDESAA